MRSQRIELIAGLVLISMSVVGIAHGLRAGVSQIIHCSTRYGSGNENITPEDASRKCEKAHKLYPYNYYLCAWMSEKAYYNLFDKEGKEIAGRKDIARAWCAKGLALNQYKSQLRLMNTRFLAEESLPEAIAYWREYVDWDFWDPYSHAVLVGYYAEAGDVESAAAELRWVEGSAHHKDSSRKLNEAWKKEMQIPDIPR
jgi:hypothetical protein